MKGALIAVCTWTVLAVLAAAQDAGGIKAANIRNANLKLMVEHDPAVERANFKLLPGYEVNLFASEPMLANPIHMVWDSRGRLWVACSWAYPQLKPGEVANDKIIILEDTDGDGAADKSTVFAEGLYMPTGIELANGGCYVAQTPDVFFLKDTDGDDVADVRELALTGFGIEDSHHSISAWRRGPGGWLYFQEGIFLHSQIETQRGMVRNYNGGVYQYNPRTQELRMFARIGVGNPWGHVFDRWGQSFFIDNPRVSYLSPSTGNSGEKVPIAKLIQTEKQCGGDLASGSHLPQEIHGQLLTCRFKSRAIIRYEFHEDGAGFSANVLPPLISSKHPNFRPVDCKVGPDGAIYVADWYNSIINHAQHDFRDPRRDHNHGRIWRITAKGRPLVKKPKFLDASLESLVGHLASPDSWTRHQARLELSEWKDRDEVVKALEGFVAGLRVEDSRYDEHLVEAMWACQNVERVSEAILEKVLSAKNGNARSAGARVIRFWHEKLSDPVALVARMAADPTPRVRMEAILSAGFIPKAEAFPAALHALDHPRDKFIEVALPQTVAALAPYWRPAIEAGTLKFSKAEHREFAMRTAGINFDKRFGAFLKKKCTTEELQSIKGQLIAEGKTKHVKMVVDALTRKPRPRYPGNYSTKWALLEALDEMAPRGDPEGAVHISRLRKLLDSRGLKGDVPVIRVLGAWKIKEAVPGMLAGIRNESWGPETVARARALGNIGETESIEALVNLTADEKAGDGRYLAVLGLIRADLDTAAPLAVALFGLEHKSVGEGPDLIVLLQEFLSQSRGVAVLAAALEGEELHPTVKAEFAQFHRETGHVPSRLLRHFQSAPSVLSMDLLKEKRGALIADVVKQGDPVRGELIYRRKELACMSCHAIGSAGPEIGPNLAAVGAAATTDYVVEAILQPNKSIAEHYDNMMITLTNGELRMGVITYKSEKEIVVRDAAKAGREIRVPRDQIKRMRAMPSLMPAGLSDQLKSRQEFLDLANFVSQLGRPGPYANDESPIIREWISGDKVYSKVNGELPMEDLDVSEEGRLSNGASPAHGFFTVLEPGKVVLDVNEVAGLALSLEELNGDGDRISNGIEITDFAAPIELKEGRYELWFMIDIPKRKGRGLRVEIAPAPGSSARVRVDRALELGGR